MAYLAISSSLEPQSIYVQAGEVSKVLFRFLPPIYGENATAEHNLLYRRWPRTS